MKKTISSAIRLLACLAALLLAPIAADASTYYTINVSRDGANLYRTAFGELVNTSQCNEQVTGSTSVLRIDSASGPVVGVVTFGNNASCNVAGVYATYEPLAAGTYAANLTWLDVGYYGDATVDPFWIVRGAPGCPVKDHVASDVFLAVTGSTHSAGPPLGTITFSPLAAPESCALYDIYAWVDLASITTFPLAVAKAGNGEGTVTSSPAALDCGATCSSDFGPGTPVSLVATAAVSSDFAGWSGACTGTGSCAVTMDAARSVTATFTLKSLPLSVSRTGSGTVDSNPAGIACGATCTASFNYGTTVTLTATPAPGQVFSGWSGAGCTGTAPCVVTVDAAKSATATFVAEPVNTFALTVTPAGTGTGTVTSAPPGIDCGSACVHSFTSPTSVTLTAAPATGSTFVGWSGACSSTANTCTVTMDAARSVTATFTLQSFSLSVTKSGSGTVSSAPAGIACGATCATNFNYGTSVTLSATPAAGWFFAGWSGAGCTGTAPCVVTVDSIKNVVATFDSQPPVTYALSVTPAGTGAGTVSSVPSGISCPAACVQTFASATSVTLAAAPSTGSSFTGWGGACTGLGTCTVTLDAAKNVTATFTLQSFALSVALVGSGTVASAPAGITCGATCTANFTYGSSVTLAATPATGWLFSGWSGAGCTGTAPCVINVGATTSVIAIFAAQPPNKFALTVTPSGTGTGTVTSSPTGINCGTTCVQSFDSPTAVVLTATPATGSTFTGWSGACTGAGSCSVTMDAVKSVTATFTLQSFALTVIRTGSGTVSSVPAGIDCGTTCVANFGYAATVTLTATPASGWLFSGWSGAGCGGTAACVVTVNAARTATATFVLQPVDTFALSVARAGTGTGTVASVPAGINCGTACVQSFAAASSVVLTATPSTGSTFAGWSGACTGSGTCTVAMTAARTATAIFNIAAPSRFTLTASKSGTGTGTVTSSPAGIDCGATCSASFDARTVITLTAVPGAASSFAGWSGACAGTGVCTVTVDATKSVAATFMAVVNVARLANISTRMQVLTGNDVMIGGFVIGGAAPKTVVVRARGPSLIPFGITNALANPKLDLYSGQTVIASNDDFGSATNLAALQASGFAPGDPKESAILMTLNPGAYTAIVSGVGNTTGVGIVEVFEVDHPEIPLANISTRGQVLTGNDVMIGGFVIQGDTAQTVVVRARGPSLVPFGITNALMNPVLQLYSGATLITSNDDWGSATNAAALTASGFAPGDTRESAILITLNPGAYTAIVTGSGGTTGVGIVEVFAQ